MKVRVYWNLHKRCFSVLVNGRVAAHATSLVLADVKFHVNQRGRERVRQSGRKEVHAYLVGHLASAYASEGGHWVRAVYNPFTLESFVDAKTGQHLTNAALVVCSITNSSRPVAMAHCAALVSASAWEANYRWE